MSLMNKELRSSFKPGVCVKCVSNISTIQQPFTCCMMGQTMEPHTFHKYTLKFD